MAMTRLMTADDLALMPDDGNRYELIRGELIEMSPTGRRHGVVAAWLTWHFVTYAEKRGGEVTASESGYRLRRNPDTVLAPDIAYTRPERVSPGDANDRFADIVPDVVVEIVSPSDRSGLRRQKLLEYQAAGVRLVLFSDPQKRTLLVHKMGCEPLELHDSDIFDGGDVMPGFQLPVKKFFER